MQNMLIIEDEKDLVEVYEAWFESCYELTTCYDGLDGINQIISRKDIDCILLDLSIPYKDGIDILEQIQKLILNPNELKIIVCSGDIPGSLYTKFENSKNVHLLPKPFLKKDIDQLLSV